MIHHYINDFCLVVFSVCFVRTDRPTVTHIQTSPKTIPASRGMSKFTEKFETIVSHANNRVQCDQPVITVRLRAYPEFWIRVRLRIRPRFAYVLQSAVSYRSGSAYTCWPKLALVIPMRDVGRQCSWYSVYVCLSWIKSPEVRCALADLLWASLSTHGNRACKLFNIRLYATLCFNYFRWHRRMFSCGSVYELLIC